MKITNREDGPSLVCSCWEGPRWGGAVRMRARHARWLRLVSPRMRCAEGVHQAAVSLGESARPQLVAAKSLLPAFSDGTQKESARVAAYAKTTCEAKQCVRAVSSQVRDGEVRCACARNARGKRELVWLRLGSASLFLVGVQQ